MIKNRYETNLDWIIEVLETAAERAQGESKKDFLTFKAMLINENKRERRLTDAPQKSSSLRPLKK